MHWLLLVFLLGLLLVPLFCNDLFDSPAYVVSFVMVVMTTLIYDDDDDANDGGHDDETRPVFSSVLN